MKWPGAKCQGGKAARGKFALSLLCIVAGLAIVGCTDDKPTTRPTSWTDQAEADPWNFDPKMEPMDVSGGGIGHFDKKAFDKDVDDVFNP